MTYTVLRELSYRFPLTTTIVSFVKLVAKLTMPLLSLSTPLSLYSIPLAWATAFYPMNMKVTFVTRGQ